MNGVSTRRCGKVIPEMADTVGVSRSTVSRETIEASEAALKKLLERRFDEVEKTSPARLATVGRDKRESQKFIDQSRPRWTNPIGAATWALGNASATHESDHEYV